MENTAISPQKWTIFNNFALKLLAFFFMTLDHVGIMLSLLYSNSFWLVVLMRSLGRLAMPIFCFLIYEGVMHTRHFGKYALRLGIMATIISISLILLYYFSGSAYAQELMGLGNIFIDLLLGAVGVYCLKQKNNGIRWLAILPLAYGLLNVGVSIYENTTLTIVHWLPFFFRTQYDWFGITLIMSFYLIYLIKDYALEQLSGKMGVEKSMIEGTGYDRKIYYTLLVTMMLAICLIHYLSSSFYLPYQWMAFFSSALLLCYNGKRGYNKAWFEYGSYLYYPIHILVIAVIYLLITL